jgi:hypothetical protein
MTGGAKASYSKYPVVGDASVVRRAFALFIDALFLFLAYMMIAIPAWSLAPGWLAYPVDITETRLLGEKVYADGAETVTVQEIQVDYFSLKRQLDSCRFAVTTREAPGAMFIRTTTEREALEPCAYLGRFDFGLWFEVRLPAQCGRGALHPLARPGLPGRALHHPPPGAARPGGGHRGGGAVIRDLA